jgi:hypothetical protein
MLNELRSTDNEFRNYLNAKKCCKSAEKIDFIISLRKGGLESVNAF